MAEDKGARSLSVEYAIQRELAFKQKIANLFADDECPQDILPLEVCFYLSILSYKTQAPSIHEINHVRFIICIQVISFLFDKTFFSPCFLGI